MLGMFHHDALAISGHDHRHAVLAAKWIALEGRVARMVVHLTVSLMRQSYSIAIVARAASPAPKLEENPHGEEDQVNGDRVCVCVL